MARQQPTKYEYKATKYFKTTVHYTLQSKHVKPQLTELLNIAKSRDFAKSLPVFWCQERKNNKWQTPRLTGLFKTEKENIYWGCRDRFKDLILFVFSNNRDNLTIYYYKDYFTRNLNPIIKNL